MREGGWVHTEVQLSAHPSPSIQMSKRTNKSWRNSQPLDPAKLAKLATIYAKLDSARFPVCPAYSAAQSVEYILDLVLAAKLRRMKFE